MFSAHRALTMLLALLAFVSVRGEMSLNPPETFFTNIANRLLQQQLGLRLNEVQIVPGNHYDSAVHRIFQITANIYDATTTNEFPAVFRPLFNVTSNGVFLAGFTNDASVSTLPAWLESNPYGVPIVIAARKGIPNFNEFTVRSDITVQRKLQVVRPSPAPGTQPIATNQMYVAGISNHFGAESWNSSYRRFSRAAQLMVSNTVTLTMGNGLGVQTTVTALQFAMTNLASNTWRGYSSLAVAGTWNTNRIGSAVGPTAGIAQQMDISLGHIPSANSEWRVFGLTQTATENDKASAINSFRYFCGLFPFSGNPFQTNSGLTMETLFNPTAKASFIKTWQANDPFIRFHLSDLTRSPNTNRQYLRPIQTGTNIAPATLGRVNQSYCPWSGPSYSTVEEPSFYDRSLRDPGVYGSDWWNFPSNSPLSAAWLGRIHRGTQWQSIYLKADVASASAWLAEGHDLRTHPTNDWRIAGLLAALFNTNDVRELTSINTTNMTSWDATLTGLSVLTNTLEEPIIGELPQFDTNVIVSGSPQISVIVDGINRKRTEQRGQYFTDVAEFLSVPELSSTSPFLRFGSERERWGMTDEAYEMLPPSCCHGCAPILSSLSPEARIPLNCASLRSMATRTVWKDRAMAKCGTR